MWVAGNPPASGHPAGVSRMAPSTKAKSPAEFFRTLRDPQNTAGAVVFVLGATRLTPGGIRRTAERLHGCHRSDFHKPRTAT